ncbi:MAG: diguanylate cyclase [Elainella sp. C42_A2020_010]|nr:diguanylate cyclase [Elainella sp. C42_A2020_010]
MIRAAIVCVDDEWTILRSLGQQLKRNFGKDYDIELISSGEDALLLCAELVAEGKQIPLIISDQKMRGMEGDALLIQLHSLYPKTLKIMLTGQADADSVGNVVNAAALYRYIRKPWDETDLILTVTEALRRFQQEQQIAEQNASLKQINARLESSLALLLATLEATADGILVLDNEGNVVSFNQRFARIWHLSDQVLGDCPQQSLDSILDALFAPDVAYFQELLAQIHTEAHNFFQLKNDRVIEYYLRPQYLNGQIVGRVWSFRDVTQAKQAEAIVKHQAFHDPLTNLPNRILFNQKFAEALAQVTDASDRQRDLLAVMFLDLDRFKQVNDTLGHAIGDGLLQQVVQRLSACLREIDLLARWGGDEFVLLLPHINSRNDASAVADRLIAALQPAFVLEGHSLHVTTSVGIAIYPDDGLDATTLLQKADTALYQAKKLGRNNCQYFSIAV